MSASSKKKLRREQNAALLTEKQQQEQVEAKKLKTQTTIFTVAIAVILVISIVLIASTGISSTGIFERNTKALTVGEHELTAADLNYFYMDVIYNTYNQWYEYYGDYMSLFLQWNEGLDPSQPLDQQQHPTFDGTWGDYFADAAVTEARNTLALCDEAKKNGFELTEEDQTDIEDTLLALETEGTLLQGYANLGEYLKAKYGRGAREDSFRSYLTNMTLAQNYYTSIYDGLTYEETDLREHEAKEPAKYSKFTFSYFNVTPDTFIEHKEGDTDHNHTEEENAAGLKAAEEAAKTLAASGATTADELTEALKKIEQYGEETTSKASHSENAAYTNINTSIAKWLAEEGRKEGDIGVVPAETTTTAEDGTETTTVTSYYVVIFHSVEENKTNMVDIRHILIKFQNGTTGENGETVYSDEEKAAAMVKINAIKEEFESGKKTEEEFAELAKKKSEDGNASTGGIYENVYPGQMVEGFNDWCFDESRKAGDYEVVETEFGYHLIYFVRTQDVTYRDYMIENDLRATEAQEWFDSVTEPKTYTVIDLSRLNLDLVLGSN